MKKIKISKNFEVIVDNDDFNLLNQYSWHIINNKYAARSIKVPNRQMLYMHRVIMNPPKGMMVDHINGNTLDNRKQNLRICERSENQRNRLKSKSKLYTKFKGVFRQKGSSTWYAEVTFNGKKYRAIGFKTDLEAAEAYNKLALTYFKEYAKLNILVNND